MATDGKKKKLGSGRHLSVIKRHRQSERRKESNKPALSTVRTVTKKLIQAIEGVDKKAAQELFIKTQSLTDRAIKKGLINVKTGHRKISRLNSRLDRLS